MSTTIKARPVNFLIHWFRKRDESIGCYWIAEISNPRDLSRNPVLIVTKNRYGISYLMSFVIHGKSTKDITGYSTEDRNVDESTWNSLREISIPYITTSYSLEAIEALKTLFASVDRPIFSLVPTLQKIIQHQIVMHEWLAYQDLNKEVLDRIVSIISEQDFMAMGWIAEHITSPLALMVWISLVSQYQDLLNIHQETLKEIK